MDERDRADARPGRTLLVFGAPLALLFAGLCAWSWGRWTDPHIDFGNELYIAWRLSEGEHLYRDIAHRNGPFSHYWNALLMRAFGVSLRTLVFANLAVLAASCALLFALLRRPFGRPAAAVAVAFFLVVFAFYTPGQIANFNHVTPYQHFQTHGLLLGLLALFALVRAREARARRVGGASGARPVVPCAFAFVGGVASGLLALGKVELFVPGLAAAAAGIAGWWWIDGRAGAGRGAMVASFAVGLTLAWLVFFALLATAMPAGLALRGMLGNLLHLGGALGDDVFYRRVSGIEHWPRSLAIMSAGLLATGIVAGLAVLADRRAGRELRPLHAALGGAALLVALLLARAWLPLASWARCLPLAVLCVLALALIPDPGRRLPERMRRERFVVCVMAVFSLGLLGKVLFEVRFDHYGFVLAAPAAVLVVAALCGAVPEALRARGSSGRLAAALLVAGVAAIAGARFEVADAWLARRDFALGAAPDTIVVEASARDPRGPILARTLAALDERMGPGDTLLVLPEGVGLNYWLRRDNPIHVNLFLPTELAAFGGDAAVVEALRAHPPDFVVLVHRSGREFGVGDFGRDPRFGRAIMEWIDARYERVAHFGAEPFTGRGFGTVILKRRPPG